MTNDHDTTVGPDEPGVDWDRYAEEVFGDEDDNATAAATADRQFHRWQAAAGLARRMEVSGADRATIARVLHESYPDITIPGYEAYNAIAAPALDEPVTTAVAVPETAVPVAAVVPAEDTEDAAMVPLTKGLMAVVALVVIAVLALAGLGFVVSFDTQTKAVEPYFGADLAPLVPLAIDLGIVVFAALNLVLARLNMSIMWLRAVPWVLTAMTLYINLSAHHELVARVAHVALPGMWIVASEVGTHVLRIRAGLEAGTRTESLGLVRWILDPLSTFRLWRYMRLWGLHTAKAARDSEAQRLESRAALHARYGCMWRFKTPIQLRTAYRLRRLDAETVYNWRPPVIVGDVPDESLEDNSEDGAAVREDTTASVPEDTATSVLEDEREDTSKDVPQDTARGRDEDTTGDARGGAGEDAPVHARRHHRLVKPLVGPVSCSTGPTLSAGKEHVMSSQNPGMIGRVDRAALGRVDNWLVSMGRSHPITWGIGRGLGFVAIGGPKRLIVKGHKKYRTWVDSTNQTITTDFTNGKTSVQTTGGPAGGGNLASVTRINPPKPPKPQAKKAKQPSKKGPSMSQAQTELKKHPIGKVYAKFASSIDAFETGEKYKHVSLVEFLADLHKGVDQLAHGLDAYATHMFNAGAHQSVLADMFGAVDAAEGVMDVVDAARRHVLALYGDIIDQESSAIGAINAAKPNTVGTGLTGTSALGAQIKRYYQIVEFAEGSEASMILADVRTAQRGYVTVQMSLESFAGRLEKAGFNRQVRDRIRQVGTATATTSASLRRTSRTMISLYAPQLRQEAKTSSHLRIVA